MTKCRDCGQPIQFIDGKPYDLDPALHYRNRGHIEAVRGKPRPVRAPAIQFSQDISEAEQEALMKAIKEAGG